MTATEIKRGDAAPVAWTLDPAPIGSVTVIIRAVGAADPVVQRAGTVAGAVVSIVLTPTETAKAGRYFVEFKSPGPVTYPSNGYLELEIVPDLT